MPVYVGTAQSSKFYVGSTQATAMYLGSTLLYTASAAVWDSQVNDTFTGTTGAAPASQWRRSTTYPTGGTVTIQNNAMRLSTGSTAAWSGSASIFLGNPAAPQSAPSIMPDAEYTFDYTLLNLSQQYQTIGIRTRSPDLWQGGAGDGQFKTGFNLQIAPSENSIYVGRAYDTADLATVPYTFTSAAMKWRILIVGTRLAFKVWAASGSEPTAWTYDNATVAADRSDGSIGFAVNNGPAAETKTVTIDNFISTTRPLGGYSGAQAAPTTAYTGFTAYFVENFNTAAAAGTGSGQFGSVYANSWTNYTQSGTMSPQTQISAHDGVMDIAMDGTKGAAGWWGPPATSASRIGGRFMMRAKAIGAMGNGPAVMIWPSSDVWSEGEIDFPESVSGSGDPTKGFQDSPWIHHHSMTPGNEASAQDVNLLVSWRDWHVYSCEWFPPNSTRGGSTGLVIYYVDEVEVYRTTQDVPSTAHRYTVQVGDYGSSGNMYIDWVRIDALA